MTNPDLIKTLEALNPTEGEWVEDEYDIVSVVNRLRMFIGVHCLDDDCTLVVLAPTTRLAILEMAKEIEELREIIHENLGTGYLTPNQK